MPPAAASAAGAGKAPNGGKGNSLSATALVPPPPDAVPATAPLVRGTHVHAPQLWWSMQAAQQLAAVRAPTLLTTDRLARKRECMRASHAQLASRPKWPET